MTKDTAEELLNVINNYIKIIERDWLDGKPYKGYETKGEAIAAMQDDLLPKIMIDGRHRMMTFNDYPYVAIMWDETDYVTGNPYLVYYDDAGSHVVTDDIDLLKRFNFYVVE